MEVRLVSYLALPPFRRYCFCFKGHKFININIAPIMRNGAALSA